MTDPTPAPTTSAAPPTRQHPASRSWCRRFKTMRPPALIIASLLAVSIAATVVNCKPNQQQQQQQQQLDKQLLKKALDESNLSKLSPAEQQQQQQQANNASSPGANFQCPEQFGYYTDARDCTKYYVCVFGEVLHESCTGGLRFSRELQTCDWPRNVECLQSAANGSAGPPASSPATPLATTLSPTSTASSVASNRQHAGAPGGTRPPSSVDEEHSGAANAEEPSGGGGDERSLKSSSSLVFADEGSDPQQPSFDEAVSPVITPDGAIHLHDGSGGTYSLTPNHNNRPPPGGGANENVDVFVKPLPLNNRARSQQQQQQQAASSNRQATSSKLQQQQQASLATSQQHHPSPHVRGNSMMQQQTHNTMQQQQPQQHSSSNNNNNNNNNNNQNNNNNNINNNNNQFSSDQSAGNEASAASTSESEPLAGDEEPANNQPDSISAQADREEAAGAEPEAGASGGAGDESDELSGDRSATIAAPPTGGSYIPPVMSPGPLQGGFRNAQPTGPANSGGGGGGGGNNRQLQQASQLLSVASNGVGLTRQNSFKPTNLVHTHHSGSPLNGAADNDNDNNNNNNNGNSNFNTNQRASLFVHDDSGNQQEEESRSHLRPNIIRQAAANQTINFNQQQQQQQQQRQLRMSPSSQFGANELGGRAQQATRFAALAPTDQSSLSNNVNFNDSSKLIRLQSSQFDLGPSSALDELPLQQPPAASPATFPKFPSAAQSSAGARSQSVLFSQQPFGFAAGDSAGAAQLDDARHPAAASESPGGGGGVGQLPSPSSGNLLQQQRRPRPPKRQQIPSANGSRRQQQQSTTAGARQASSLATLDAPDSTTVASAPTAAGQQSFLSSLGGGGGGHSAAYLDPEVAGQQTATTTTGTRAASQQSMAGGLGHQHHQQQRPIVAPTTVNFHQQDSAAGFSTIPPAATTIGAGRRLIEQQQSAGGQAGSAARNLQNLNTNQGQQRSAHQLLLATGNEPPGSLITTTATANANQPSTPPTANQQHDQQDPQLVANRYLNSAIDALEAGQPFGTVDYEFDILNDNSTERRNPTTTTTAAAAAATSATRQPTGGVGNGGAHSAIQAQSNNSTPFNSNPNAGQRRQQTANKQRQQQQQQQPAFNLQATGDDGDSISLTNGQPSGSGGGGGGQIGLNLRPHQSGGSATNLRSGGGGGAGRAQQAANSRQQQPQQFGQEPFAPNPQQASGQQPTKKPRPTNKKITVNHEQALANNRASVEPARRPEALFTTPSALQQATKCDNRVCRLPDCKCGDTLVPGGLEPKAIPQIVLLTFDDAVNDLNWEIYEELFTGRTNPNGCPILATFYVSHEWTDYGQVQTLYSRGHEMASHSVTHSFGEKFSKSQWFKEVNGQREILNMYGGVKMNDVRGMRAPFLQIGGNKMFEMLYDANFTYDSSMPIFENSPPLWPYTLDYQLNHECMITPCPSKSFPGVWEVGMTMWVDLRGGRCSMGDACSNPPDEDGVYEMLMKNFNRHYKSNRAPFGLFYHSAWFNTVHHRRGFLRFMGTVNALSDVFFVTNWQMLQWMRKPTPLSEINSFEPWQCPAKNDRPPPCFHPSVCNVKSEHGTRFMKTCQPCPVSQQYPWVGATGFKGKQAGSGGSG